MNGWDNEVGSKEWERLGDRLIAYNMFTYSICIFIGHMKTR